MYFKIACLALVLIGLVLTDETLDKEFSEWASKHKKSYSRSNSMIRRKIWESNYRKIKDHNKEAALGKQSYTMGLNEFSDLTFEEFSSKYLGYKPTDVKKTLYPTVSIPRVKAPSAIDWRLLGFNTTVRNQGICGSCWAFAATGAIEGQYFIATKTHATFSPQQLVDCDTKNYNYGCDGGMYDRAFDYVIKNGIMLDSTYPYASASSGLSYSCKFDSLKVAAKMTGYAYTNANSFTDEVSLTNSIATNGPVAVAIYVSSNFQNYKSGVFYDTKCNLNSGGYPQINHAVLAIGYGTDSASGRDFYIVKNTWGTSWGEGGYIRMSRNANSNCAIASYPVYPTGVLPTSGFSTSSTTTKPTTSTTKASSTTTTTTRATTTTRTTTKARATTSTRSTTTSKMLSTSIDSIILSSQEAQNLLSITKAQSLTLLYRATRDGFSSLNFHQKVDGKAHTTTVIRTNSNFIFGGYTSVTWDSYSGFKDDSLAFLFSLRRNGVTNSERFNITQSKYAIFSFSSYGPSFGGGFDIYINSRPNLATGSYTNFCYSYSCPCGYSMGGLSNINSYLAGSFSSFLVTEIETFLTSF